ncbi:MAG: hypothetical protein BWY70_01118 [Bacteroidetes bacterium ADurb.Bin408]|nr:MAG: hypothetical protein BWY70_01118 [Bacteroidetes bacterium ADurb.Bin408]
MSVIPGKTGFEIGITDNIIDVARQDFFVGQVNRDKVAGAGRYVGIAELRSARDVSAVSGEDMAAGKFVCDTPFNTIVKEILFFGIPVRIIREFAVFHVSCAPERSC